jgi:hypothetical protein
LSAFSECPRKLPFYAAIVLDINSRLVLARIAAEHDTTAASQEITRPRFSPHSSRQS